MRYGRPTRRVSGMWRRDQMKPFFMVFREGGNSPIVKQDTELPATSEARWIARTSGSTTHVLVSVSEQRPFPKPTMHELRAHTEQNGVVFGGIDGVYGLWRAGLAGGPPIIVPVSSRGMVFSGPTSRLPTNIDGFCQDYQWWPLDSDGKDVSDDIPF